MALNPIVIAKLDLVFDIGLLVRYDCLLLLVPPLKQIKTIKEVAHLLGVTLLLFRADQEVVLNFPAETFEVFFLDR